MRLCNMLLHPQLPWGAVPVVRWTSCMDDYDDDDDGGDDNQHKHGVRRSCSHGNVVQRWGQQQRQGGQ